MQPLSRPPISSDEHVSCTAHATENASLQVLFRCPTPAKLLKLLQDLPVLLTCDKVQNPGAGHAKRHLKVQVLSEHLVL